MRKILVLAGGADQIALIENLKDRGFYVILVDYYENPPAKLYADRHIVASTLDKERVMQIAIEEQVMMVCTACTDQALLTMAYVSEQLSLPCYLSYETAKAVTNKLYMKSIMLENGIPTSKYLVATAHDDIDVEGFKFPLVVKPADCNSSKGVQRVDSIDDLNSKVDCAIGLSRTSRAIVEEYIEGEELSVDAYIDNGVVKILAITSSKKIRNRDTFTIVGSLYPAVNSAIEERIERVASQIATSFKLDNMPLLIQLILHDKSISVIEFSARMGGGSKCHLIRRISGVDIISIFVDMILGGKPCVTPKQQQNHCRMVYIYCRPGVFDSVEGVDRLKREGIVEEYFLYKTRGMQINGAENSGDRPAGYLVVASTKEELKEKLLYADTHIKVLNSEGEDIMLHNLY